MRTLPPLKALQAFEAAARHRSVKLAADELNVTPSAISHQVKALEMHLGVLLFHRTNRKVILTDVGRSYLELIQGAFDRIDGATRKIVEDGFTDVLTVHCAPSFAPAWLMPRLHSFLEENPDIDIRLHATPEPCEFVRGNVDVEIRYGHGDWPGLHVTPLMTELVTPMCAPALLKGLSDPPRPGDLVHAPLLHSERSMVSWPRWFDANGVEGANITRGPRFDRGYLSLQAAVDGWGFALESTVFAERELRAGQLFMPFVKSSVSIEVLSHYLVCPETAHEVPKVRKFREWICRQAEPSSRVQN